MGSGGEREREREMESGRGGGREWIGELVSAVFFSPWPFGSSTSPLTSTAPYCV